MQTQASADHRLHRSRASGPTRAMTAKGKRAAAPAASPKAKAAASPKAKAAASAAKNLSHILALGRPLDVISHCSGWLSESQALDRLGIPHAVRMASDINPRVKDFIVNNHTINYWTDDVTSVPVSDMPAGDVFVCGFPCQPFSKAGKIMVPMTIACGPWLF